MQGLQRRPQSVWLHLAVCLIAGCTGPAAQPPGDLHDAGVFIIEGDSSPTVTHTFQVRNPKDRRVNFLDLKQSCACTSAGFAQKSLAPGESCDLTVTASLPRNDTRMSVIVELVTDHPDFPSWIYQLSYRTVPSVQIVPQQIDLGAFPYHSDGSPQTTVTHSVTVQSAHRADDPQARVFRPSAADANGMASRVLSESTETVPESIVISRYTIQVSGTIDQSRPGRHAADLPIGTYGSSPIFVAVRWTVEAPWKAVPPIIGFGLVPRGESRRVSITLSPAAASQESLPSQVTSRLPARSPSSLKVELATIPVGESPTHAVISAELQVAANETLPVLSGEMVISAPPGSSPRAELTIPFTAFLPN